MTKFLVVDDEADLEVLIKQKFRKKIREQAASSSSTSSSEAPE